MSIGLTSFSKRDNNIELLRLFLMFLIVLEHVVGHGCGILKVLLESPDNPVSLSLEHLILYVPAIMSVDCFVFISGYYQIKFSLKGLLNLYMQVLIVSILLLIVYTCTTSDFSFLMVIKSFFPISSNYWWFLSTYILLYLASPFLNEMSNVLSKRHFGLVVGVLVIFNCFGGYIWGTFNANSGYSILNFICLYLLAIYMRRYNLFSRVKCPLFIFSIFTVLLIGLCLYFQQYGGKYILKLLNYNNPLIILLAVLLFAFFLKICISWDLRKFSSLTFGIYLFHDNEIVRSLIESVVSLYQFSGYGLLLFSFCIYVSAGYMEFMRKIVSRMLCIDLLVERIARKI